MLCALQFRSILGLAFFQMRLRKLNSVVFLLGAILAAVGLLEHIGVSPLFSTLSLSIADLSLLNLSFFDVLNFLTANVFWMLFVGWLSLALGTKHLSHNSPCQSYLGEVISETGGVPVHVVWTASAPALEQLADPIL